MAANVIRTGADKYGTVLEVNTTTWRYKMGRANKDISEWSTGELTWLVENIYDSLNMNKNRTKIIDFLQGSTLYCPDDEADALVDLCELRDETVVTVSNTNGDLMSFATREDDEDDVIDEDSDASEADISALSLVRECRSTIDDAHKRLDAAK